MDIYPFLTDEDFSPVLDFEPESVAPVSLSTVAAPSPKSALALKFIPTLNELD